MNKPLLLPAAILICLVSTQARLSACECVGPILPCLAMEQAQAVFVGQVTEIVNVDQTTQRASPLPIARRVSFKLTEVLRGDVPESVDVYTGLGGGDCGFKFDAGKTYLVYAHRAAMGPLTTGICARTKEANSSAQNEIKELRVLAREPRKCTQQ
jgi:hypothetical protein